MTANTLLLGEAISELLRYSLIHYNKERQACSMHRLVQAVLKDEMPAEERHQWAERVVRALNHTFPESDVTTWPQCQRYLPHAQVCVSWIEQEHLLFPEAASLLNRIAHYLKDLAFYAQALPLYQRALAIREKMLGPTHPNTKTVRANHARLLESIKRKKK